MRPMPSQELGAALRFYEVSLRYAPAPQAKGTTSGRSACPRAPANALID